MMRALRLDRSGAGAAEFALVLPLLVLLLFGIIDGGRFLWEANKAEKATQAGARVAIVTDVMDDGLANEQYVDQVVGGVTLTQGDVIPAAALGELECTETGCACISGTCPTIDEPADYSVRFNRVVQRMQFMKEDIDPSDVTITYRGSGLGFAGDPNGMEIAPLVTVELDASFDPLVLFGAASIKLPTFRSTLTAEDSVGSLSN
jgi:hypothetical protein